MKKCVATAAHFFVNCSVLSLCRETVKNPVSTASPVRGAAAFITLFAPIFINEFLFDINFFRSEMFFE